MKALLCRVGLLIVIALCRWSAVAATPQAVTYQGRLVDAAGPVNGARALVFEIYTAESGGARLYCETNTPVCYDGLFSTALGTRQPTEFVAALAGGAAWLQVSVGGQALGGRQRLLAVPYAIHAGSAPITEGSVSNSHIAAGAITGSKLASGAVTSGALAAGAVTSEAMAAGSVTSGALAAGAVTSEALAAGAVGARELACRFSVGAAVMVTNPAPYEFGSFGGAAADLGDLGFLVGASGDGVGGEDRAGAVYWYDPDGAFRMTVTNPAPSQGDYFGGTIEALWGGRFAVGVSAEWAGAQNSGVVYLFGSEGTRLATVTNPVPAADARFGCSVAAVGAGRFVAGAYGQAAGGADYAGAAYLFAADGALLLAVTNPTPASSEMFGRTVAEAGPDRFAVGAPQDKLYYAGAVYLYDTSGACLATVTNPAPDNGDLFGGALASVGSDRFVAGAPYDDPGGLSNAGSAWLFRSDGTLVGAVADPAPAANGKFGEYVWRVGADKFAVGAPYTVVGGVSNAGVAHLYWEDGTYIMTFTNPVPTVGDYFGMTVSGAGPGGIVVGASGWDRGMGLNGAGTAWLYPTECLLSGVAVDRLAAGTVKAEAIAAGAVTGGALSTGAVSSGAIAAGAVTSDALAAGAVTADALAAGCASALAIWRRAR